MKKAGPVAADNSHHHRRGHIRRTGSGDVVPVRDTRVKNRVRVDTSEPRSATSREALIGLTENDDVDVNDIVFAFEHPEWSSHGFRRHEIQEWVECDIDPEDAETWRAAGHDAAFAKTWKSPLWQNQRLSPEDALVYIDHDIPPRDAQQFLRVGFSAAEAIRWNELGARPHEAHQWRSMDVTLEQAKEFHKLGFADPADLRNLSFFSKSDAHNWFANGVHLETALKYQELIGHGHQIEDIAAVIKSPKTGDVDDHYDWVESAVPVDQIVGFAEKGYTIRRAEQLSKKGVAADAAPDLHGGEPVPGKSWTGIKDVVAAEAAAKNYDMAISARDISSSRTVKVTLTGRDDPTDTKTFWIRFSHSGAFQEAKSNIPRRTRVLKTKAEFLRLHFPGQDN